MGDPDSEYNDNYPDIEIDDCYFLVIVLTPFGPALMAFGMN